MENKNHPIKLIYNFEDKSFKPDNEPEVKPGESISFQLVTVPHQAAKFRITMDKTGYFEPTEATSSKAKMTLEMKLEKQLEEKITYKCELIDPDTNIVVIRSAEGYGGGVRPGH